MLALLAGCRQSGDRPHSEPAASGSPAAGSAVAGSAAGSAAAGSAAPAPYTSDIENLCDAMSRSGADQLSPAERQLAVAEWLGAHLQTDQAHQYLVKIQPLEGEAKAAALEAEARRVGLPGCPLAAEWRTTSAR
ncbi:MAG TPA: hypothetical protein VFP84_32240 [Kofleriaceae bacterium]|nr:hypothetical protein [Kofleriaceae bacterium]